MSSILKALRRLEEERARKSSMAPEIAASLLRHRPQRPSAPRWLWPAAFSAVGLLLAASLWFWRPMAPPTQIVAPTPSAAPPSATTSSEQGRELIIEEVIDQRKPVLLPPPTLSVATTAPLSAVASKSLPPDQASKATPAVIEERQSPVVSAIAWQEDSSARMAVVDGLPVMTGEFVDNVKVQEILRDRIIFAEDGNLFIVYVDSQ